MFRLNYALFYFAIHKSIYVCDASYLKSVLINFIHSLLSFSSFYLELYFAISVFYSLMAFIICSKRFCVVYLFWYVQELFSELHFILSFFSNELHLLLFCLLPRKQRFIYNVLVCNFLIIFHKIIFLWVYFYIFITRN